MEGLAVVRMGKLCFRPKVHVDVSKSQQKQKNRIWETLVEDELASLEGMAELPSVESLIRILQKCRTMKNISCAKRTHMVMQESGLEAHETLGNYLVSTLVECGSMPEAEHVFHRLTHQNEFSWNSLIQGHIYNGNAQHAFDLFWKMQDDWVLPNRYTFQVLLKACVQMKSVQSGQEMHMEIAKGGLESDPSVGSTLVDMYAKLDSLAEAQGVFDKLLSRDVVSWTTLITGYAEHGLGEEALSCLEEMQGEGVLPNAITFVGSLKACGNIQAIDRAQEIHSEITKEGLERDSFIGSTLMDTYFKCGSPAQAQHVFNQLLVRDVVSWTALISGYVEHGLAEEALNCLEQMKLDGVPPNAVTFICSLRALGSVQAIDKAFELHTEIAKEVFQKDPSLGSALVDMYAKCGLLVEAQDVFDEMPVQNVVSWTALVAGYAEHGHGEEALGGCLEKMQQEGVSPDAVSYVCILKACGSIGSIVRGQEIHGRIVKKGFEKDLSVGNTMVDMYAKCGLLVEARDLFNDLPVQTAVSWTALIAGYAENGFSKEALSCLEKMQLEGITLDAVTFVCSLKACSYIHALGRGQELHSNIIKTGFERDSCVGSALVDLYANCGSLLEAEEVFDELPVQNTVLWNTLMTGYAECGLCGKVLNCLEKMQGNGMSPDVVSLVCGLKVCGSMGAIDTGKELHATVVKAGLENDAFVGNTLVDMYAKYGSLAEAWSVFDGLQVRDVVSWTGLIIGYACQGESDLVFHLFEKMIENGIRPDRVAILSLLTACSHAGLVDKGHKYFEDISKEYAITPTIEHHNCMVDLFGRAGQLDEAVKVVEEMPFQPNHMTWNILLGACRKWGDVELARHAFESAVSLDEKEAAGFILMSNVYVDAHIQGNGRGIEMNDKCMEKASEELGFWWWNGDTFVNEARICEVNS